MMTVPGYPAAVNSRHLKILSAAVGAGVLVTMGALTAVYGADEINTTQPTNGGAGDPTSRETTKVEPQVTATTSEGEWVPFPEVATPTTSAETEVTATTSEGEWVPFPEVPAPPVPTGPAA
jgi:hypothetical protein